MKKTLLKIIFAVIVISFSACKETGKKSVSQKIDKMNQYDQVDWINTTNVYEVNLRQYTQAGTINEFAKELPRLKEMGVETLWFMPMTPIAEKNKKGPLGSQYAAADYTSISNEFGNVEDFKKLVTEAHKMGFKVIIDWVANHTGWDHKWTKEHPEYYLKDSASKDFKIASGMDDIIELDYGNPALRKAMIDAMKFWITETDIDGFRCDLAAWVEVDFWQEARTALQPTKKLFWLGEFDPTENKDYMTVFDAAYSWQWMHKTEDFYKDTLPLAVLDSLLHDYNAMLAQGALPLWFTSNHDENSWNGTEVEKYGNMADALAVFSFTYPGVPLIYSGQELPNKKRLKFFEKDVIEWDGTYQKSAFYKTLTSLKKSNSALDARAGSVKRLHPEGAQEKVLSYVRENNGKIVLVLLNLSKDAVQFTLDDVAIDGSFKEIFNSNNEVKLNKQSKYSLAAWGYKVYSN